MIREKIKVEDFDRISKENEFFIWNFVNLQNWHLEIQSIFTYESPSHPNAMKKILELISVPYFETELKDAFDFLMNLETRFIHNVYQNNDFQPVFVSFNRKRMVNCTYHPNCYCSQGIIDIIGELNPQFILDSKL